MSSIRPSHITSSAAVLAFALTALLASPIHGTPASLERLVGKTVWNNAVYRLVKADGSSFRIKTLAPMKLVRLAQDPGGETIPWFEVEGKGEARPSDADVARIKDRRAAGKLPAGWAWVFDVDPRTLHKDWDDRNWAAITDRTIIGDMTPEMVRMAFGEPDKINVNKRPGSVQEMWVYATGSIWFVDGKVFSWQAP